MSREQDRPVPFWPAARSVFGLALDEMVWSRRSAVMGGLLALPVLLAAIYRIVLTTRLPRVSAFDLYGSVIAVYYIRNLLPLAALFYAAALIADEVEGKTLTYLVTRPIRRESILAGKFAAYLTTTLSLALPPAVLTFFALMSTRWQGLGARVGDLFIDLGVVGLTLLTYGALFTLLGVLLRRPVIPGLIFLFVWELIANFPGYMPRLTITGYLRSLIRHRPAEEGLAAILGSEILPAPLCLEVLIGTTLLCLVGAAWIFSNREYVMEQ
jgi:ABC-2 type transport system permease protein